MPLLILQRVIGLLYEYRRVLGWLLLAVGLYMWGHSNGTASATVDCMKTQQLQRQATEKERAVLEQDIHAASQAFEKYKQAHAATQQTIVKEVIREVSKPVYRKCVVPPSGVRLLNSARTGEAPSTPQPDDPVPAPSAPAEPSDFGGLGAG